MSVLLSSVSFGGLFDLEAHDGGERAVRVLELDAQRRRRVGHLDRAARQLAVQIHCAPTLCVSYQNSKKTRKKK